MLKKVIFFNFFWNLCAKGIDIYEKSVNMGYIENLMRKRSKNIVWHRTKKEENNEEESNCNTNSLVFPYIDLNY